jgi:hypothetical protein
MARINYATLLATGGFAGETFDIAQGPADTGIIDVLLSVGAGALTCDAPHALVSTGALGAAVALDISGMEVETAAEGSMALNGRFFFLSVQNSDIVTNNLTITSSVTINGAASLVIKAQGDYLFTHEEGGKWRANILPLPSEAHATIARIPFLATDWDAGAVKNTIKILQTGVPAAGQVGPHKLKVYHSYNVDIINKDLTPNEMVDVEIQFNADGSILLKKAPKAADFAGVAVIVGSLD